MVCYHYYESTSTLNKVLPREYLGLCPATPFSLTFDSRVGAVMGRNWIMARFKFTTNTFKNFQFKTFNEI